MRWTLYRRFLLALIPTFALFAAAGLALGSHLDTTTRAEDLALRVGNLGGRIAAALDRHDALSNQRLAEDLLGTFGTDAAVLCVELRAAEAGARLAAAYPPGLGCKGMTATAVAGIPVGDTAHMLSIHYSDAEIAATGRRRWITTLGVLVAAFVATLASATIGYRVMVGRRLRALHAALTATPTDGTRREIEPGSRDELGEIVEAFNAMVRRDEARETLMRQDAERLADQSRRDALTGLLNRRYFEQWTAQTGPRHREEPGLLGLIDIDRFKSVNDTHGHAVGDEVLVAVARRLAQVLRPDDILVRWGGEEFLLYMPGRHDADLLAHRILRSINREPVATTAGALKVTVSLGLAALPLRVDGFTLSIERVLILADRALYAAKNSGRNRAVYVDALRLTRTSQLAALEDDVLQGPRSGWADVHTVMGEMDDVAV